MKLALHADTHAIPPTNPDKARACVFRAYKFTHTQERFDLNNQHTVASPLPPSPFLTPAPN